MKPLYTLLLCLSLLSSAQAQTKLGVVSLSLHKNQGEGERKALVMANQKYTYQSPYKTPSAMPIAWL